MEGGREGGREKRKEREAGREGGRREREDVGGGRDVTHVLITSWCACIPPGHSVSVRQLLLPARR